MADTVLEALCDDLNMPLAISALHGLADRALEGDREASAELQASAALLGLLQQTPAAWFQGGADAGAIEAAIGERAAAKAARDFARTAAIRTRLRDDGVLLEDMATGTTRRRA